MDIEWHEEAEKEFFQLPEDVQREIKLYVEKIPEEGLEWENIGFIQREDLGLEVYRLKIMPEEDEGLNHRVIFDVEGQSYVIYKVGKRPGFYEDESLGEVEKRI